MYTYSVIHDGKSEAHAPIHPYTHTPIHPCTHTQTLKWVRVIEWPSFSSNHLPRIEACLPFLSNCSQSTHTNHTGNRFSKESITTCTCTCACPMYDLCWSCYSCLPHSGEWGGQGSDWCTSSVVSTRVSCTLMKPGSCDFEALGSGWCHSEVMWWSVQWCQR